MASEISIRFLRSLITKSFVLVVMSCGLAGVQAQDKMKQPTVLQLQARDFRIPVVQLSPRDVASTPVPMPGLKIEKKPITGPAPPALTWSDRTSLLRRSGVSILPPRPPRTLRLTARQPYVAGAGSLEFQRAFLVLPEEDRVSFMPPADGYAYLVARINLESGGRYLVDFNVTAYFATTFYLFVGDNRLEFVTAGGPQHVSVLIESAGAGPATIYVSSSTQYVFHSMEMMRLDETGSR
jgi:hypothetical protein